MNIQSKSEIHDTDCKGYQEKEQATATEKSNKDHKIPSEGTSEEVYPEVIKPTELPGQTLIKDKQ